MAKKIVTPSDELGTKLWAWARLQSQLADLKAQEMGIRKELVFEFQPKRKVGTVTINLPGDWKVKIVNTNNVNIDESALPAALELMEEGSEDLLIKYKPTLVAKEYKDLDEEQKKLLDEALLTKPGSPALTLIAPGATGPGNLA